MKTEADAHDKVLRSRDMLEEFVKLQRELGVKETWRRLLANFNGREALTRRGNQLANLFSLFDLFTLVLVPVVTAYRLAESGGVDVGAALNLPAEDLSLLASLAGGLQVSLAFQLLEVRTRPPAPISSDYTG